MEVDGLRNGWLGPHSGDVPLRFGPSSWYLLSRFASLLAAGLLLALALPRWPRGRYRLVTLSPFRPFWRCTPRRSQRHAPAGRPTAPRRHLVATIATLAPCRSAGRAMTRASVTVVVPTKNAARTLQACLESIVRQSVRCGLVVVDCGSVDDSRAIASGYADLVLNVAPYFSGQRNLGARALPADIVGFIDADMVVGEHVLKQAIEQIAAGVGSVVVPERSFGENYWAKVRAFERSMYLGTLEWARFFSYDLFEAIGGYDEDLAAMEDTDLGIRASTRARVGRTSDVILHDEGALDLPYGMPQEGPLRDRDRRLPPQTRKPGVCIASQAPVLRAPVVALRPANPRAGRPCLEGRRSSGRRGPSPARQGFEVRAQDPARSSPIKPSCTRWSRLQSCEGRSCHVIASQD